VVEAQYRDALLVGAVIHPVDHEAESYPLRRPVARFA
jgi:hypothetical protein